MQIEGDVLLVIISAAFSGIIYLLKPKTLSDNISISVREEQDTPTLKEVVSGIVMLSNAKPCQY